VNSDVVSTIKRRIKSLPLFGPAAMSAKAWVSRSVFPGSARYWERWYAGGGSSGPGSFGQLAGFKADVVNAFVESNGVRSVIEFGCGDGNQLSLARYPKYIGLDVSRTAIGLCKQRFADDPAKSFFLYDPQCFVDRDGLFRADLALSLDVVFHLIEDTVFEAYMTHLFSSAERFVIIYSIDSEAHATVGYVRNRRFSPWVQQHIPEWALVEKIDNRFPWRGDLRTGSLSDFYVYARR